MENKGFIFLTSGPRSITFLDRTVAARRPEISRREHGWDNPGRPGKGWRQLVPPSPPCRVSGVGRQISPAPLAGVVSGQATRNQELSGEARLETAHEPSQAHRKFRPVRRRSYPEGFGCYCADQNAVAPSGGPTPPKGPVRLRNGRARAARRRGASEPGKVRQTSSMGRRETHVTPLQNERQPES